MFLQQNKGAGAARTIEGDRGGINVPCMCARRAAGGVGRGISNRIRVRRGMPAGRRLRTGMSAISAMSAHFPRGMSAAVRLRAKVYVCPLSAGHVCGTLP